MKRVAPRTGVTSLTVSACIALMLAACGSSSTNRSSAGAAATSSASATPANASTSGPTAKCGAGTGKPATGTPITISGLVTNQPGLEGFTDSTDMISDYFKCVNADGGIHGHPVKYTVYQDKVDPQVAKQLGSRLLAGHPDAIIDGISVLDCAVNVPTYGKLGYYVIGVGVTNDCFVSPYFAPVNIGAGSSNIATAQYLASQGVKKIAIYTSNQPGAALINQGVADFARSKGIQISTNLVNVPISNANAVALSMVNTAGSGGGVIVNFNPPETVQVLQAVVQQGLQSRVKWGCPSGCNDASVVKSIGSAWNGKLGINAEFKLPEDGGPDGNLLLQIAKQYGAPTDAFAEMGFLAARNATTAMLSLPASKLNQPGINAAFRAINNFKTDLYCRSWYYGSFPYHLADNVVSTLTIQNGKLAPVQGCFSLAATPTNHLAQIRAYERANGL